MRKLTITSPSFLLIMEDTVNTCLGLSWTPHQIVQTLMGSRRNHRVYSFNARGSWKKSGAVACQEN